MSNNSEKFRYNSAYRPDSSAIAVKYGFDRPLLEVELNESQDIQNELRKNVTRNLMPSGFTEIVSKNFLADPIIYNPVSSYNNVLNAIAIAPCKAVVNGYIINLTGNFSTDSASDYILLNLGDPPYTGTREDLVYLEVWFEKVSYQDDFYKNGYIKGNTIPYKIMDSRVNEETTRRIVIKYDIKVVHDVDFVHFPDGLGYVDINNYSNIQATIDGKLGYSRNMNLVYRPSTDTIFKDCEFYKDYNLYIAGRPDYEFTVDNLVGNYIFALPMFRIRRRNQEPYTINNFNGSRTSVYKYQESNSSAEGDLLGKIRPDKLCYDLIDKTDIIDLRRSVSTDILNDYYLNKGLKDLFTGKLQTKSTQTMRRVQFGREALQYSSDNGVIMHASFDDKTLTPDTISGYPSEESYIGEMPKYRDSVTGYGLYVDGKSEYTYTLTDLTSHVGTVDFYMQPYFDGYNDYNQTIFAIIDSNDNPIYTLKKRGSKLIADIYTQATITEANKRQQIVVDLTNILLFAKRIYHIRFAWSDNSSLNKALVYVNGAIVGETTYMGSSLTPVKIVIGNKDDYIDNNPIEESSEEETTPSSYIGEGEQTLVQDEIILNKDNALAYTKYRMFADDGENIYPLDNIVTSSADSRTVYNDVFRVDANIIPTDEEIEEIKKQEPIHDITPERVDENINYGFILEELTVYRVSYEQNISNGIYSYISNNYWPNIPQDFIANQALIYPSFNETYMNFSDNDIKQQNTLQILTGENGVFTLQPPYMKSISEQPKIYKIAGEVDRFGKIIQLDGIWKKSGSNYIFTAKDATVTEAIVQYTLDLPNGNGGEDLPNEILAAGLVDADNILEECSFARLYTDDLREVKYLNPARVSAAVDRAFDRSTNRDERQCYARLLYYHQSGNGTNHYELPSHLYGYPIISIINATNRLITNVVKYDDTSEASGRFVITLETNVAYGDVIEFQIALGGWTFDYETQTKTLVANLHKTKMLKVVADGNRNEFLIPCYEENGNGGVLKSVCNVIVNHLNTIGTVESQTNEYACYIDNEMYPLLPDRDSAGNILDTWSHQLCKMVVDETSFGTPFLKITLDFTPADGQVLNIPVLISYQPKQDEILSIWYNYVPYQGILDKTHKKLKRLTDWKYFITTLGSGNDTLNVDEENINSLNNIVNRLPGGNSFGSLLTGEKIMFNDVHKKDANYELRFVQDVLFTSIDNKFDDAFFELDVDMEVYRLTSGFQDEQLNYTFNSFKAYLPDNISKISKYTGMASIVMDEKGQILLFVIGCLNNGDISHNKSAENIIKPIYGDLFKLDTLPTTLRRN